MATLFGKTYTREELLRRAGNPAQLAGIFPVRLDGGGADGSRALLLRTGSGLEAVLLPDRCLDILSLHYRGARISFLCKNGPTSPDAGLPVEGNFNACVEGGMLFTAGLLHVGPDSRDAEGRYHPAHGNIGFSRAEQLAADAFWEGDEYRLSVRGVMRESRLFGENLTLTRTVSSRLGADEIELCDRVENLDSEPVNYAILYHCNLGFPFLSPETKLCFPEGRVIPRTPEAAAGLAEADRVTAPQDGFFEHVFFREVSAGADGWVRVRAENPALGVRFTLAYEQKNLPELIQWRSMRSGDYALGIEPANCRIRGRAEELARGALPALPGFSSVEFRLRFSCEAM